MTQWRIFLNVERMSIVEKLSYDPNRFCSVFVSIFVKKFVVIT